VATVIAPGTFAALGIPLMRGRDFGPADVNRDTAVAIVNETLAHRAFPSQDPIGHVIFSGFDATIPMKIVGIVGDVRQTGPAVAPQPQLYVPYPEHSFYATGLSVVARTALDPASLWEPMRRKMRQLAPDASIKFTTMDALRAETVAPEWFRTLLLGIFASLAVCLAMAGVYGVMACLVSQRSSEIGLRMALGASPTDVLRLMLRQALRLAVAGLALGLAGAFAATRLISAMLFEVRPTDPLTYALVTILLATAALAASYFPARRAAHLDPLVTLRQQ
jgi:predicted permease